MPILPSSVAGGHSSIAAFANNFVHFAAADKILTDKVHRVSLQLQSFSSRQFTTIFKWTGVR